MTQPLTVTPPFTCPTKLFCPPSVPWNMGVAVGVVAIDDPLGVTVSLVPLGAIAAAFRAFVGVGVGVAAGVDIPLIIAAAAAGSTTLLNDSVGPVPLVPWFPPLTTN